MDSRGVGNDDIMKKVGLQLVCVTLFPTHAAQCDMTCGLFVGHLHARTPAWNATIQRALSGKLAAKSEAHL